MDDERLLLSRTQPNEVLIKPWWIARRPELHRHVVVVIDFAVRIRPIDFKYRRIAVSNRASLDRLVLGSAFAKPLERLSDGVIGDR
jgi:hypothetical protein